MIFNFIALSLVFCCFLQPIHSFCIYNNANSAWFTIYQDHYDTWANPTAAFKAHLGPGGKQCCAYNNKDCSAGQNVDSPVEFDLYVDNGPKYYGLAMQAGGYINVTNAAGSDQLVVTMCYPNGTLGGIRTQGV